MMTEREKAQQGLGYMPWDSTLTMERKRAYDLCYEYRSPSRLYVEGYRHKPYSLPTDINPRENGLHRQRV